MLDSDEKEILIKMSGPTVKGAYVEIALKSYRDRKRGYTLEVADGDPESVECIGFMGHTESEFEYVTDDWYRDEGGVTIFIPKKHEDWTNRGAI